MAVPGHPFDARASGCNQLIRDGALLVRGPADVVEALSPQGPVRRPSAAAAAPRPASPALPAVPLEGIEGRILDRLGPSPLAEDQLIRDLALPASAVTPAIVALELEGRLLRQPGGLLARLDA
jgi:DNA processing protein